MTSYHACGITKIGQSWVESPYCSKQMICLYPAELKSGFLPIFDDLGLQPLAVHSTSPCDLRSMWAMNAMHLIGISRSDFVLHNLEFFFLLELVF